MHQRPKQQWWETWYQLPLPFPYLSVGTVHSPGFVPVSSLSNLNVYSQPFYLVVANYSQILNVTTFSSFSRSYIYTVEHQRWIIFKTILQRISIVQRMRPMNRLIQKLFVISWAAISSEIWNTIENDIRDDWPTKHDLYYQQDDIHFSQWLDFTLADYRKLCRDYQQEIHCQLNN